MGDTAQAKKELTAAEAARMVRRPVTTVVKKDGAVVKDEGGNPVTETKYVPVAAKEVLAFKDHETHVVVVTVDGQKFSSADTPTGKAE